LDWLEAISKEHPTTSKGNWSPRFRNIGEKSSNIFPNIRVDRKLNKRYKEGNTIKPKSITKEAILAEISNWAVEYFVENKIVLKLMGIHNPGELLNRIQKNTKVPKEAIGWYCLILNSEEAKYLYKD